MNTPNGDEAAPITPDKDGAAVSAEAKGPAAGSDAAEALRFAVAETR
jgi:hypothetical protein